MPIAQDPQPPLLQPTLLQLQHVRETPLQWLWPGRLAVGKLNLLVAPPGLGKSLIALDVAARISAGSHWPDQLDETPQPGGVLLITDRADIAHTIVPRLKAAEADLARINALTSFKPDPFAPDDTDIRIEDLSCLEQAIQDTPDCRALILDPIVQATRGSIAVGQMAGHLAIGPLCRLAAKHCIALLALAPIKHVGSALALQNAVNALPFSPRAATVSTLVPDKYQNDYRYLVPLQSALTHNTPALAYQITATEETHHAPHVTWEEAPSGLTLERAFDTLDVQVQRKEVTQWLRSLLAKEPLPASDLLYYAKEDGISARSLRNAFNAIGGLHIRKGYGTAGKWLWALNAEQVDTEPQPESQNQERIDPRDCSDYEQDMKEQMIELDREFAEEGLLPGMPNYDPDDDF